ncbi:unnamed protein product, partial [Discosporangium mesarthrocarpum]
EGGGEAWVPAVLEPIRKRYFPNITLYLPKGAYTPGHTFAHLSGYLISKVSETPAQGGEPAAGGGASTPSGTVVTRVDGEEGGAIATAAAAGTSPVIIRERKTLKEVVVAQDPPAVHVFDVVEHGRRFLRTLVFSSDAGLSLASRPPSGVMEAGDATAHLVAGDPLCHPHRGSSLVITRAAQVTGAGEAKHIPARLLCGLVPDALLSDYNFWQHENDNLVGIPRKLNRYRRRGTSAINTPTVPGANCREPSGADGSVAKVKNGSGGDAQNGR